MLVDPNFKCRERFNTIAQMGWEQCIALQPTDLFAYEAFKEFERNREGLPTSRDIVYCGVLAKEASSEVMQGD